MKEEWRPIPGYENYFASSLGRVKSTSKWQWWLAKEKERILVQCKSRSGYLHVLLYKNSTTRRRFRVNRVILMAFHGMPPSDIHQSAHLDGNKENNAISNLAWKTPRENRLDAHLHGAYAKGERQHKAKLIDEDIRRMFDMDVMGAKRMDIAAYFGVSAQNVSEIILRQIWKHVERL